MTQPRTLVEKIWDEHVVAEDPGAPAVLAIDLHLVHEVTSPQAFTGLRTRGIGVRRPDKTVATADHGTPTTPRGLPMVDMQAAAQIRQLETNCADFGIPIHAFGSDTQGIVHVIGPELGLTQPGMTIVCGDSHTATHGAFGALAFGIGTSEVEMVLATQTLLQRRPRTYEVRVDGRLAPGRQREGHHPRAHRPHRHRRRHRPRLRVPRRGDPRAEHGTADDDLQHEHRGRRARRARSPRTRRPSSTSAAAATRPQGAAWDEAVAALAHAPHGRRRRLRQVASSSTRRPSSRWSPTATTRAWASRSPAACPVPRTPPTRPPAAASSARSSTWASTPGQADRRPAGRRRVHRHLHEQPDQRPAPRGERAQGPPRRRRACGS